MRLAVSMYSYAAAVREGRLDLRGFIHEAARTGAEGVELLTYFYRDVDVDREAVHSALAETGLPCPIFSVSQNFAKADPEARRIELEKIRFGIGEAVRYGAKIVRVFAGDVSPGITFDQARAWIVEGLAEATQIAADNGVTLALENHGTLAGRGDQVRGLIADVRATSGRTCIGANPDTGNFLLVNQASHVAMREVADLAEMVHFKDFVPEPADHEGFAYTALDGQRFLGAAIGEGMVDLPACLTALRDASFDGCLSLEYEGEEDPITAVPRSLANARALI